MSKKALSADLVAAYRATEYRVSAQEPFTLHVDQHSKALAKLYRDTGDTRASFLTADNPFSVPASAMARPDMAWPAATSSTSLPVTRASLRSAAACARLPSSTPQAGQPASPSTPSAVGYLPPLCGIITNVLSSNNPHSSFGDSDSGACGDGSGVARRSPSHWV